MAGATAAMPWLVWNKWRLACRYSSNRSLEVSCGALLDEAEPEERMQKLSLTYRPDQKLNVLSNGISQGACSNILYRE